MADLADTAQDDAMYYLTRLEGQLVRLGTYTATADQFQRSEVMKIVDAAKAFAQSLRDVLDPSCLY